jgi:glycosyltransferase involved in cell wall biosynthesis
LRKKKGKGETQAILPLESTVCGTPVITSNTTSIPEIFGDAALQISPNSQEESEI